MILATHGIVGSQIVQFSAAAIEAAFNGRVVAAGGSLTTTERNALVTLIDSLNNNGIWSKMKAIYPIVGSSAAACSQNLKSSSFTGSFTSGWTFASTGATPNGTSAYFDSNFNQSSNLTPSNNSISIYSRSNVNSGGFPNLRVDCGVTNNISYAYTELLSRDGGSASYANGSQNPAATVADSLGHYIGVGNVSNAKIYKNGTSLNTNSTTQIRTMYNKNIFFAATNDATSNVARYFSNRQYAFWSIGDSLTDTEASNFYTAVQAFNTSLSRQV